MSKQSGAGIIIYQKTPQGILYLLLYHGGRYWNFPKGKIEGDNEKIWETALREVREETGLQKKNLHFHHSFKENGSFSFKRNNKKITKKITYFLAESNKKFISLTTHEHRGYAWFTLKEAKRFVNHQKTINLLEKAEKTIRKNK